MTHVYPKVKYGVPQLFEDILFADLEALKTDGVRGSGRSCYRFVINCGTCHITVAADCTPDEMQTYIMSLVSNNEFGNLIKAEEEELERKIAEEEERKRRQEEAAKASDALSYRN